VAQLTVSRTIAVCSGRLLYPAIRVRSWSYYRSRFPRISYDCSANKLVHVVAPAVAMCLAWSAKYLMQAVCYCDHCANRESRRACGADGHSGEKADY
jgi:hypothetical protein